MTVLCPVCNSPRIISARHDQDWGGGNSMATVNDDIFYTDFDIDSDGNIAECGDINIFICLACGFAWQRYVDIQKVLANHFMPRKTK